MIRKPCNPYNFNTINIISEQQIGIKHYMGYKDNIKKKLYSSFKQDDNLHKSSYSNQVGAIFNLEFSLDGRILVAACEEKCMLLFDAANQQQIRLEKNIHDGYVNNVKFISDIQFATCSEDPNVKIWDIRSFRQPIQTLQGNSKLIKDIQYDKENHLLITSSLRGNIDVWDLNNSESNLHYERSLNLKSITRLKLTPDGTKMVIATVNGYIFLIHDLNIRKLCSERMELSHTIYRLRESKELCPSATIINTLLDQSCKHNRLEVIADFPSNAKIITSLQIHPMGWSALSRSVDPLKNEDWTTLHDIQYRIPDEYLNTNKHVDDININEQLGNCMQDPRHRKTDIWMAFCKSDGQYLMNIEELAIFDTGLNGLTLFDIAMGLENLIVIPRLNYYTTENHFGTDIIKEPCFSNDGRIICTPYNRGVRLFGFSKNVEELGYCVSDSSKEFIEIIFKDNCHTHFALCCKFNPFHYQLVTGGLDSKVVWYKPIL